jgi:Flp pilus assembly protein protease CpaA
MTLQISLWMFLAACFVASYTDVRWRRVPNALSYGCMAVIIALSAPHGFIPFLSAIGSAIIVLFAGSFVFGLAVSPTHWPSAPVHAFTPLRKVSHHGYGSFIK